jgi:hypothetical protein
MEDGGRLRFQVHSDGAVYELRKSGNRRVTQEPFRSQVYRFAFPVLARDLN